ncbi:MAG TPA: hypothetical protein VFJ02_14440 [Vicinamibacterales bacterium]|nr:hypothetical protein [Vicinamibacterales bacterium]
MPWRQLRAALRERVTPPLCDRIGLHQARYRYTREEVGRVWLTIDGREIVQFDTSTYLRRRAQLAAELREANRLAANGDHDGQSDYLAADAAAADTLRRAGLYDDYGALADLEAYLSLPIDEALDSPSPLIRGLAVIDRRVGKRRLRAMAPADDEHPLVRELYALRCQADGITGREAEA